MKIKAATGGNKKILFPASPRGAALLCPILTTPPLQWSSEYTDRGLVYYNYRHYNPLDGRWTGRDSFNEAVGFNLYSYMGDTPISSLDFLGLAKSFSPGCSWYETASSCTCVKQCKRKK